ncbi:hypothetical protein BpHYR1_021049 [Brachionus plicatilis]|uniref:Uncharacterized protein n=1 Tax=Brachionus plicatilis TaxID=10195 RepID=A0A3M7P6C3_BRAPC|nr:hypothetical protein BpHYR1_021049 [Brachionus plicatilis]
MNANIKFYDYSNKENKAFSLINLSIFQPTDLILLSLIEKRTDEKHKDCFRDNNYSTIHMF